MTKLASGVHVGVVALHDQLRAAHISEERFADMTGMHPNTVPRWFRGISPGVDNLEAALNAVGYKLVVVEK